MPRVYPPLEGQQRNAALPPSIIESAAGFTAGVVSTLVVHPFDVVKTRLQIEVKGQSLSAQRTSWDVMKEIAAEGKKVVQRQGAAAGTARVVQNYYRGLMPNMIGNSVSWALYFMWYGSIKDYVRAARGGTVRELRGSDYFLASTAAGILTAIATNPIWVIKTRMLSKARDAPGAYRSVIHGTTELYRTEGLRGFYRGLVPSLFGVSHGAIQFMAYEQLKNRWALSREGGKEGLTNLDYLYLSAVSKIFAGSITYPYQLVRTRLQVDGVGGRYKGAWDVVRKVWAREGFVGFYKGLVPNIIRVLPSTCVTFLVYENMKHHLPRMWGQEREISED
ncbi:hypothetical protein BAUCODRAFT_32699 [Baudoinia panamericana UAMH 10762]|uniref:Uncharacterized protein n=1 Tax=Baudoinia panamericana (strain UAMH 10762) TaxID=717646 RepID=M2MZB4_BAUPA|nr:uncharacterized protein BAUCODRAFT_32699 [Baudoinia panamericana UAMH 10762]EMC96953.1 hypothetical protein BAUCODRAFT_32699 [Baudoinia panamericana UAMH 10762]